MSAIQSGLAGIQQAFASLDRTASRLAQAPLNAGESADSVDLSAAAVALISARNQGAIGVKTVQAQDELDKSLLNILG